MYTPRVLITLPLSEGSTLTVTDTRHHHLSRVLRLKVGDAIVVFNGEGGEFPASVTSLSKTATTLHLMEHNPVCRETKLRVTLYISVLKRDAMNAALQRATELGAAAIVPMFTQHLSEKRAQAERREASWRAIIEHACEQSGRTRVPLLAQAKPFSEAITAPEATAFDCKLIANISDQPKPSLSSRPIKTLALAIGPEGGFSQDEIALATQHGFIQYAIGSRVLRAETAPAALLAHLYTVFGEYP